MEEDSVREVIEVIARSLVDHPDQVTVTAATRGGETVIELRCAEKDMGKVIGRQGRTARAMRTILRAAGMKLHHRFTLEIME